jgi:hypothetical protein
MHLHSNCHRQACPSRPNILNTRQAAAGPRPSPCSSPDLGVVLLVQEGPDGPVLPLLGVSVLAPGAVELRQGAPHVAGGVQQRLRAPPVLGALGVHRLPQRGLDVAIRLQLLRTVATQGGGQEQVSALCAGCCWGGGWGAGRPSLQDVGGLGMKFEPTCSLVAEPDVAAQVQLMGCMA